MTTSPSSSHQISPDGGTRASGTVERKKWMLSCNSDIRYPLVCFYIWHRRSVYLIDPVYCSGCIDKVIYLLLHNILATFGRQGAKSRRRPSRPVPVSPYSRMVCLSFIENQIQLLTVG